MTILFGSAPTKDGFGMTKDKFSMTGEKRNESIFRCIADKNTGIFL